MAQLQRFAGGGTGLGGSLAARQFLDEPGQNRFLQPSVIYGLGTGALASALWYTDIDTPVIDDDFWVSHALTSVPTGAFFAAFPRRANQTTAQQVREALSGGGGMGGGDGGNGNGDANTERVSITQAGRAGGNGMNSRPR